MYLLVEIRDGTAPQDIDEITPVDLKLFNTLDDAIIFAEPYYLTSEDEGTLIIVSEEGEFGIVPRTETPHIPELQNVWINTGLAKVFFQRSDQVFNR